MFCFVFFVFFSGKHRRTAFKDTKGETSLLFICDTKKWLSLWGPNTTNSQDYNLNENVNIYIFSKLIVDYYLEGEKEYNWDGHNDLVKNWENGQKHKLLKQAKKDIIANWPDPLTEGLPGVHSKIPEWKLDVSARGYGS